MGEILTQLRSLGQEYEAIPVSKVKSWPTKEMLKGTGKTFVIGSIIGTFIGILPGIGQTTASLFAYTTSRQTSKHPEKFGTGIPEGIVASETANNACCGGAIIPMLTMGIPGDLVTSILLGGLVVHGLQPGPLLFQTSLDVVGVVFVAFFLANIIMYIMEMGLMKVFIKLLAVPMNLLFPVILLMCVVGTITVHNRLFDTWVLLIIGLIGYMLSSNGFPLSPIVLGYILGKIIESNFRTAVIASKGSVAALFSRPIAIFLLLFAVAMLVIPAILEKRSKQKSAEPNA